MGFKSSSSAALFLSLTLLLFACTIASDYGTYYDTPTIPTPINPKPQPTPSPTVHTPTKPTPKPQPTPSPTVHTPTKPTPKPQPKPSPIVHTPTKPTPKPQPTPSPTVYTPTKPTPKPRPTPSNPAKCPRDTLKIGACANLLGGLLGAIIGHPPSHPCCTLIDGLVDIQAAVCLCTALKVNVIGVKLDINIALSTLINTCGKKIPSGYRCA